MLKKPFLKNNIFILFFVLFIISCDKEYNVIGSDLIGEGSFSLNKEESTVIAYNQKIGAVQSDNLAINALGVYDNPSFGSTTAHFVTQLSLGTVAPTFADDATIKSVVLSIPYFYDKTKTVTKEDGTHTYVLDSIYGATNAKFKLSVYESGYYMRSLDPEDQFLSPQKYYTDQYFDFNPLVVGSRLNDAADKAQNDEFFFDAAEHVIKTTDSNTQAVTTTYSPPAMQLNLNIAVFKERILDAPAAVLATNDAFKEYFKGLYFKVEKTADSPGNLAMINFKGGAITITYEETEDAKKVEKTFTLNLSGNTVSLLNQSNTNPNYESATKPENINKITGDSDLYLKGGEGSLAIVELFGEDNFGEDGLTGAPNGVADKLDQMRYKKYLINDASLVFHLNSTAMAGSPIPQRIYLYDFTNNIPIMDYYDNSVNSSNTKNSRFVYGGILAKATEAKGGGYYYKFSLTNHVRNLVKYKDSTNVKLGLVVTEDIATSSFSMLKGSNPDPKKVPKASVMNPLGAIIYGGTTSVPAEKRLKLEIYYTKPN